MFQVARIALLAVLAGTLPLGLAAPLPAATMHSTKFTYRYDFNDGLRPDQSDADNSGQMDFTWVNSANGTATVASGILTMETTTTSGDNYFGSTDASQSWQVLAPTVATGYSIEFRAKVISSLAYPFAVLASPAGTNDHAYLRIDTTAQRWGSTPIGGAQSNSDDFHVFRIVQSPQSSIYSVWRDGKLLADDLGPGFSYGLNRVLFGDVSGSHGGKVEVDYFRFTKGAYAPDPRLNVFDMAPGLKNLDFVTVGNRGNAPASPSNTNYDENDHAAAFGHGSVEYNYRISKYEVTNAQYAEFLEAVAATDGHGLYHANMASSTWGGITRDGESGSYTYSIKGDMGNKPVNFVSWYDAARFANWLTTGDTESGVYNTTDWSVDRGFRNDDGIAYALPTEDEWYKAAYYDPDTESYFLYPTGSDTAPASEAPHGGDNSANYAAALNPQHLTNVGAYIDSASPYGTFDQGGNLFEWNETWIWDEEQWKRGARGGSFYSSSLAAELAASASKMSWVPQDQWATYGFRVVMIPEPGVLTSLLCGAIAGLMWRRRRK